MEKKSPEKKLITSWKIIGIGVVLAIIGAMTAQEYQVNLWLWIGLLVIIIGIVYHLIMVRCPYCSHSLAGYRPLPRECPKCHKTFEE